MVWAREPRSRHWNGPGYALRVEHVLFHREAPQARSARESAMRANYYQWKYDRHRRSGAPTCLLRYGRARTGSGTRVRSKKATGIQQGIQVDRLGLQHKVHGHGSRETGRLSRPAGYLRRVRVPCTTDVENSSWSRQSDIVHRTTHAPRRGGLTSPLHHQRVRHSCRLRRLFSSSWLA